MPRAHVTRLFEKLQAADSEPVTELQYHTPFELLCAVILSAQATDVGVNKATAKLFPIANTPQAILDLGEAGLKQYISSIGLYNSKAKNIIGACQLLVGEYAGEVPDKREALEKLPGVGRKTANVVLNVLFGEPTIAVDTHIFRVGNRTGLAPGKTPLAVEKGLLAAIPKKFLRHAHHWLVLHGRYVCTARKPKCHLCPIFDECRWVEKQGISG
ncbi:MAG: endonuclease III [Zetaproteobacteria bacterium CG12_big_fil_rev_8_21_14_0_65_55_1124]|nr:MAG: endonuclease III [Zetaproteobacteria bacterium CG1_02_55_237]PIS20177.1 MAG: endonuclease III [Zetaproteobacteria bacterium CG08_land_8_20_14_0_20_55_17]PIW42701.1 MAG: endonuclease III [Zetaproteobacteria bacterium CG12_big_fil_rev_8_21_14_0_65_55_1124]PIY53715.1 MAG: endonuclease III [Zetaproteobacteria bacterium CG_4_10_14_0_8_um_filter_55_43]PIZ38824.1 MAG: endonuclease III [Zetaproteobacteria bacterium CG_4_10_14_0_2_um_filter_55_20]PJB81450.1 MAG: endonuclease III [Zetaproteobact